MNGVLSNIVGIYGNLQSKCYVRNSWHGYCCSLDISFGLRLLGSQDSQETGETQERLNNTGHIYFLGVP